MNATFPIYIQMLAHFCINIVQFKVISLQFAVIILGMIPG